MLAELLPGLDRVTEMTSLALVLWLGFHPLFCVPSGAWLQVPVTVHPSPGLPSCFQVAHFKDYIPQAFPGGHSMILDSEVLLIDNNTGKPLPFGTLGVHKVLVGAVCVRTKCACVRAVILQREYVT